MGSPFLLNAGIAISNEELDDKYRDKRYVVELQVDMFLEDDYIVGAATHKPGQLDMYCAICFDLGEEEDGHLEEELQGIGVCVYDTVLNDFRHDGRYFGTVEATSGTTFKFLNFEESDWDLDNGNGVLNSKIVGTASAFNAVFVS